MSVNIKENGDLTTVANNISITQANWNDRGNTNKNTCIKNQPATLKTLEEVSANTDENALVGANAVKELNDSLATKKYTIQANSGWTTEVRAFKSGNVVTVTGTLQKDSETLNTPICKLSQELIPQENVRVAAIIHASTSSQDNPMVTITTNGEMKLTGGTGGILSSTKLHRFTLTYVV